jgi:molybdopterin-synthase adenylyltransferase
VLENAGKEKSRGALVVGAGALGIPAALALLAAGARRLGIADGDAVDTSNLHRQLLYLPGDEGESKAEVAASRLRAIRPGIAVVARPERVTARNAASLAGEYDVLVDATDGTASKFLLNDVAVLLERPLVHGGVLGFGGQLLTILPRRTACLRCLFPEPPHEGEVPSCTEAGIFGPLAGWIGNLQGEEAGRILHQREPAFADRLFSLDLRTLRARHVPLRRSPLCPLCGPEATIHEVIVSESVCEESS